MEITVECILCSRQSIMLAMGKQIHLMEILAVIDSISNYFIPYI